MFVCCMIPVTSGAVAVSGVVGSEFESMARLGACGAC